MNFETFRAIFLTFVAVAIGSIAFQAINDYQESNSQDLVEIDTMCVEAISNISSLNTALVERQALMTAIVAGFEEENRSLKCSLSDAVNKMQSQEERINELIDQNTSYMIQVKQLEQSLKKTKAELKEAKDKLENIPEPC